MTAIRGNRATQKSSRALNRPDSTFFRTENRAVMGFSKKDLGDVVWSSETSRDPVFLTSRPKDIAYPQLLSIQTLDRRTTGAALFQMERRPFIRSGLVQAKTTHRRTNTNVLRSEMQTNPIQDTPSPDPNSELQRKSAFIRSARRYQRPRPVAGDSPAGRCSCGGAPLP